MKLLGEQREPMVASYSLTRPGPQTRPAARPSRSSSELLNILEQESRSEKVTLRTRFDAFPFVSAGAAQRFRPLSALTHPWIARLLGPRGWIGGEAVAGTSAVIPMARVRALPRKWGLDGLLDDAVGAR
jgi:hypothetical protein